MARNLRACGAALVTAAALLMPPLAAAHAAAVDAAPHAVTTPARDDAAVLSTRLYAVGLDRISRFYVDGAELRTLVAGGLNGLTAIDPAVQVDVAPEGIALSLDGKPVVVAPYPSDDDTAIWAGMLTLAVKAVGERSPAIAAATPEQIHEAVFKGFASKLDRFSGYTTPADAADRRSSRNGFTGTGIRYVRIDGKLLVKEVFRDGPSDGIVQPGDVLLQADGADLAPMTKEELTHALRGPTGTKVVLTVLRGEAPVTLTIERGKVVPQSVTVDMRDGVAVARVSRFNAETAESLRKALDQAGALKGVVLDLRGNPGGLLDQAVAIADLFLDHGAIISTRGRHPMSRQSYKAKPGDILNGAPLVVLVDGRAASSSEILSAALQDNGRATVMGTNTYGKGSVQRVVTLPDGGELKVTWSRFYSPRGYAIADLGILPSICLKSGEETADAGAADSVSASASASAGVDAGEGATVAALPVDVSLQEKWRTVPLEDTAGRSSLRAACASQSRADQAQDLTAALELIHGGTPSPAEKVVRINASSVAPRR